MGGGHLDPRTSERAMEQRVNVRRRRGGQVSPQNLSNSRAERWRGSTVEGVSIWVSRRRVAGLGALKSDHLKQQGGVGIWGGCEGLAFGIGNGRLRTSDARHNCQLTAPQKPE